MDDDFNLGGLDAEIDAIADALAGDILGEDDMAAVLEFLKAAGSFSSLLKPFVW